MYFLQDAPRYLLFTGKGGVGKTSIACATAVQLAEEGKRVLLVSTDPASNLAQVFGQSIGHQVLALSAVANLCAMEIDPQQAAQQYRERIVGPVRGALPAQIVRDIEEQLSGACTTEIAAFDEFTRLLTDAALSRDFDHIVFDTAPTGHTIRLLQLPGAWSSFIEDNPQGASCLGPLAGLEQQRAQYHAALAALTDARQTRLVLVARAQKSSLAEAARTQGELAETGFIQQHLVINGVLPASEATQDPLAQVILERQALALADCPATLRQLPTDHLTLKPFNLVGLSALRQLFVAEASDTIGESSGTCHLPLPPLASLLDELAQDDHGLIMVMGKGGVGKTSLAAALAVGLAERGWPVHLSTTDPAAHLQDLGADAHPNLTLSRIDPQLEIQRYRQSVLDRQGQHLDEAGRAMLAEDLRSPCTEEIAVFQAFSKLIRQASRGFVVLDTAPTGHTLLLLDASGAYDREVRKKGGGMQLRTPMMQLQDAKLTKVLIATLAETTPVLEAANLQADLRRAGIEPWAWVVNQSLAAALPTSPLLQQRAKNELAQLESVATQHAQRYAVVPMQMQEPTGLRALHQLLQT